MPLVRDPFTPPEAYVGIGAQDAPEPSFMETVGAAYRLENLIGSAIASARLDMPSQEFFRVDPGYNPYDDIAGYEDFESRFEQAYNPKATAAIKADIDREKEDRDTLSRAGWTGLGLSMAAGMTDPTILIPGGAIVRAGKVGYSAGRSALAIGAAAAAGTAVQEAGLQATQETRTAGETALAIGGAAVLGGLIGAAGAKLLTKGEWNRLAANLEQELAEEVVNPAEVADTIVARMRSVGAASVEDAVKLDDLGVGGPAAARAVANATAALRINPGVETMFSPSKEVRKTYAQMVDNPIYTQMNMEGRSLGPDVENLVKRYQRGALGEWVELVRGGLFKGGLYREAKAAGFKGTRDDFMRRVAEAGRRGDADPLGDPYVTKAAQAAREKIFDPLLERAKAAGLLPEDVTVSTSATYVARYWNRQRLIGEEARFREITEDWLRDRLQRLDPQEIKLEPTPIDPEIKTRLEMEYSADQSALEAIKVSRASAPKIQRYPVIDIIRSSGGVRTGSPLASELNALGVTPRSFPGLFRKNGGLSAIDNLVISEHEVLSDNFARSASGYADPDELMNAIGRELAGDPILTFSQRDALSAYDDTTRFADEWLAMRGIDPNASIAEIRRLLKITDYEASQTRTLEDLLFEDAQMTEGYRAQARARSRVPEFVSRADLDDYIDETVSSIFNNLTGKGDGDVPEWLVPVKRGPLKERTFNIPDERIEDFLENDMEMILHRYTRTVPAEIELADKFGSADMKDAFKAIRDEYTDLRKKARGDTKALEKLESAEERDLTNLSAFRDMIRGTYRAAEEGSSWGKISRAALAWNYIRLLGGVTLTSLSDTSRLLGVHGMRATMREALPALVSNVKAIKISKADAKALGAVTESVLNSRLATLMELNDPYRYGSKFERFLANVTTTFSKATGLAWWNDTMKTIASVMTQNRIARNAVDWGGASRNEKAYMALLGINEDVAQRIAAQIKRHGVQEQGVWGVNVNQWDDDVARRAWAAALNKDVDRTIVTKGVTDTPLWMRTNTGRLIMQFKSFGLASHQRVLISGLQNDQHRLAEMMAFATPIGMMVAYLKFIERGDFDQAERLLENPGLWISDGLDRTGLLSIPYEISNTAEKLGSPVGFTGAAQFIAGDPDRGGTVSRYASRNKLGAVLGPSAGIFNDLTAIAEQLSQRDLKQSGVNAMIRQIPGATLPGVRTGVHLGLKPWLTDAVD